MNRDLRATLREFLLLDYGLTYKQCEMIAEKFSQYLVNMGDPNLIVIGNSPYTELTYTLTNEFVVKEGQCII